MFARQKLFLFLASLLFPAACRILSPKEEVHQLFDWSINQYLQKAYPHDTLRPISCAPVEQAAILDSDVYSNNPSMLIDSITTFITMKDDEGFIHVAELIRAAFSLDEGVRVQLFEFNIRVLGSFISSHLHATNLKEKKNKYIHYDGWFLQAALDVGNELIEGFKSPSGLPFPRVQFGRGILDLLTNEPELMAENNPVALAAPFLEFTMLSILSGDDKFRIASEFSLDVVIRELRSAETGLLSFSYDVMKKNPREYVSGVGANVDSVMEYLLKGSILFDNDYYLDLFDELFRAVGIYQDRKWFYQVVSSVSGWVAVPWIDSLAAYLPGTLVLDGNIETSELKNLFYVKLWGNYRAIPERWNFDQRYEEPDIALEWYPLRPEMIESCYFLYQATRDPFYLHVGEEVLKDIKTRYTCECGLCGVQDLRTGELQDETETFVLGETLKYLYLLFDYADKDHYDVSNVVFTTEAHPLYLTNQMLDNYYQNRFFNDSFFSKDTKYAKFINKTINYNHEITHRTCPNIPLPAGLNESPMMKRGDLFHFDAEYGSNLKPLPYLDLDYDRLELNPEFYDLYNQNSISSIINIFNHSKTYTTDVTGAAGSVRQYKVSENKISENYYKSFIGCQIGFNLLNSTQQQLLSASFGLTHDPPEFAVLTRLDYDSFTFEDTIFISKNYIRNQTEPIDIYEKVNSITPFSDLTVTLHNCVGCDIDFVVDFSDPQFLSNRNIKKINAYYEKNIADTVKSWVPDFTDSFLITDSQKLVPVRIGQYILVNVFYTE